MTMQRGSLVRHEYEWNVSTEPVSEYSLVADIRRIAYGMFRLPACKGRTNRYDTRITAETKLKSEDRAYIYDYDRHYTGANDHHPDACRPSGVTLVPILIAVTGGLERRCVGDCGWVRPTR